MSKKKENLLVVAHPDDETIFFAGLILSQSKANWHVVCVTDGNADGLGTERKKQFLKACRTLGVKQVTNLTFSDQFDQRIDIHALKSQLQILSKPQIVFTHGPIGEYGHPHHQDISLAVHEVFSKQAPVWSVAYNCLSALSVHMSKKHYKIKTDLFSKIYFGETERFINFVPATSSEFFVKLSLSEVREIYKYMIASKNNKLSSQQLRLQTYAWLRPYFKSLREATRNRPF